MITQDDTLTSLRGSIEDRPTFSPDLRASLQAELESALRDIEGPLTIDKSSMTKVLACEGRYVAHDPFAWSVPMAIGTLVHKTIELLIGGHEGPLENATFGALQRLRRTQPSFDQILKDEVDNVGTEVFDPAVDLVVKYAEMFPEMKDNWWPNVEASTSAWVGYRRVILRGKIDLKLGGNVGQQSGTILIDFKTGSPSYSDFDDLRFYALLETLRTGVPPFRWANVYLSSGQVSHEDATEALLWGAVTRVINGTPKIAALKDGGEATLTPGPACRFCPANMTCEEALT